MDDWVVIRFTDAGIWFLDRADTVGTTDLSRGRRLTERAARDMAFTKWRGYPLSLEDAQRTLTEWIRLQA